MFARKIYGRYGETRREIPPERLFAGREFPPRRNGALRSRLRCYAKRGVPVANRLLLQPRADLTLRFVAGNACTALDATRGFLDRGHHAGVLRAILPRSVVGHLSHGSERLFFSRHQRTRSRRAGRASGHFHSSSAPRLRRFSTKRGWARLMISALRTTDLPGIAAATMARATAARMM